VLDDIVAPADSTSAQILRKFHGLMLEQYIPRSTYGDGNCLYRAVSLALYGTEEHHEYVRLRTAIELMTYHDTYDIADGILSSSAVAPASYSRLLKDAVTLGEYAELAHIYAVSAAFDLVVQSYMPSATVGYDHYTRRVVGRGVCPQAAPKFTIMWTMTHVPRRAAEFVANHFVLLTERSRTSLSVEHDGDDDNVAISGEANGDTSTTSDAELSSVYNTADCDYTDASTISATEHSVASVIVDTDGVDGVPDDVTQLAVAESVTELPRPDGLNTAEVVNIIHSVNSDCVLSRIPRGRKDNVYCVVSNVANVQHKCNGKNNAFDDDCGAWQSNAHWCNYPYLIDDNGLPKRIFYQKSTD